MNKIAYIPMDRRLALARGESLPERTRGTALFADISGFTPLADAFVQALGAPRAAEEITRQLNLVYDALVAQVHQYRGSVIGFVGDAITCWFGEEMREERREMKENELSSFVSPLSSLRAVACALGMQQALMPFATIEVASSVRVSLAIKIGVATGTARRFLFGDPQIQLIDTLVGETLRQMAQAEQLAENGEVVLAPSTCIALNVIASRTFAEFILSKANGLGVNSAAKQSPSQSGDRFASFPSLRSGQALATANTAPRNDSVTIAAWRTHPDTGEQFAVINELITPVAPTPWDESAADSLTEDQIRPWILSSLYERMQSGQEQFLSELRAATALFVLFDGIDYEHDEMASGKLDAYIRWVQRIVHRYQGNLIQLTIGDKGSFLYAVFGAPIAHDDDPYRAIQAALELQRLSTVIASTFASLSVNSAKQSPSRNLETPALACGASVASSQSFDSAALRSGSLLAMTQRIGIAEGQMRVGAYGAQTQRTYGAISDVVNLANRLMMVAPPGEIRCDYNIFRSTNKRVAFETLPPVRVKGKSGLIRVYRPVSGQSSAVGGQSTLVGRRAEIAEIETALDAVQAGATRVLMIEGEAGIGKSRLMDELMRLARERGLTGLIGNGQSIEQQTPYRAWRDVFSSYFELDEVTAVSERRERVQTLVPQLVPDQVQRFPLLNDVLGLALPDNDLTKSLAPDLRRQNLVTLLTALLRAWAIERPLILILEDAHWLDGLSWQFALQVVRSLSLAHAPLLFVMVNRPLDETSAGQAIFRELQTMDITRTLTLSGFAPAEIVTLISNRLGVAVDALPAPLATFVQTRSNGNPFFAEELVLNLRDTGAIETWKVSETFQVSQTLPDTLHGLILSRIDRLPPERQFILKVAAVIGRTFAFAPLYHTLNQYTAMVEPVLKDHLALLTTADFTFLESLEPDLTYIFKHIITQEAAYQTLLFSQRRELHCHVAEWYENSGQWTVDSGQKKESTHYPPSTTHYPLLVYHYHHAEDREKERQYARLAGEQAASQYANDAAVSYLSRALELTPADDEVTRRALLSAREAIYHIQGKRQAQVADQDSLAALAQMSGDSLAQAQVFLRRAKLAVETGDYAAAVAHAQATLGAAQDQRLQVAGQIEWGRALARQAKYADAREHLTQALGLAQSAGLCDLQADSLHTLGIILGEEGNYARAEDCFVQALNIRREMGDQPGEGNALHSLGNIAIFQADYPRASEYYERAVAIFRKIGARTDEGVTLGNLGTVALYQSDYAKAASHYTETLLIARETGSRRNESNALGNLGIVARYREDYAQSIAYTEQALAIDRAIGHRQGAGRKLNSLGETTRMQGDYGRATEYYAQALAIARELGERRSESIALGNLGLVALGRQDYERAREHYTQALAMARQLGDQDRMGYTLTGLGEAHAGVEQLDAAASALQQAIAVRRKIGQLPLLMESIAALARVYLAQGNLAEAHAVIQEIVTYVDEGRALDGANEPLQILLTGYQVLAADHHPRAAEMLQIAFDRLRQRVARIPDPATRRSLMENVPWHREIIKAWAQGAQMSLDEALEKISEQSTVRYVAS